MNTLQHAHMLAQKYGFNTDKLSLKPIGNGHINTTLLLTHAKGSAVVQKLNTQVFPNTDALVDNARSIEAHLKDKQQAGEYDLEIITHLPTCDDQYLIHANNEVWRALAFIGKSYSQEVVETPEQAYIAASAFGRFAAALEDFEATRLYPVIKDFHNLNMRLNALNEAAHNDPSQRLAQVSDLVEFCSGQSHLVDELAQLEGVVPLRPCHNDTKINNMLFCTQAHQAKAVIDLDTCMPGYWLFDFGDMVRTFCSPEEEDSKNIDNVHVRADIFEAIVNGYIEPLNSLITEQEKASFWLGAKVMPFMIGVRFLTDYLNGDVYFATKYDEHNLVRAKNQFALYRDIISRSDELSALITHA